MLQLNKNPKINTFNPINNEGSLTVIGVFIALLALSTKLGPYSWNDASRLATIQALVEHHTFSIDVTAFNWTADKYLYQGHFYSDKPPILAIYGAVFYFLIHHILKLSFYSQDKLTSYLVTLFTIGGLSCIGLLYFRKTLIELFKTSHIWGNLLTLIAGAGTLILPYSTVFNNHTTSGALLLIGVYYLLKPHRLRHICFSGLFMSLAGGVDLNCFLFIPFAAVLLALTQSIRASLIFCVSCLPIIAIFLGLNLHTSGSMMPPAMNAALWDYPGSAFNPQNLSGVAGHNDLVGFLNYSFHMLLGNRGLLSYTPILVFSCFSLVLVVQRRSPLMPAYLLIGMATISYLLLYISRTVNYSGYSFGIRWYANLMLILCLPIAHLEYQLKTVRSLRFLFISVACISFAIAIIGSYNPFTPDNLSDIDRYYAGPTNTFLINLKLIATEASTVDKLKLLATAGLVYGTFYRLLKAWQQSKPG
jgi:hypothetical protein